MAQVIDDASLAEAERLQAEREAMAERQKKREEFENNKLNWRNRVAAVADRAREEKDAEFFGGEPKTIVPDPEPEHINEATTTEQAAGDQDASGSQEEATQEAASAASDVAEDEETDGSLLVTKTINGKRVTRSVDEWIALASKVEDADSYYQEAARKFHEARRSPEPAVDPNALREAAKKIQLGSEDEAVEGVETLVKQAVDSANRAKREEDQLVAARVVYDTFAREYADVTSDPILNAALVRIDQQLIDEGKVFDADPLRNFDKRLRHVGDQVRSWKKGVADVSVKQEKRQHLVDKKLKISNLNTANQKQTAPQERALSERDGRDQAVRDMFAARKKKAF